MSQENVPISNNLQTMSPCGLYPLYLEDQQLANICTSQRWQQLMKSSMPYSSADAFNHAADNAFSLLDEEDWHQAFAGHPMIGDINSLKKKYAHGASLSQSEQSQVQLADDALLSELIELNQQYLAKFGFIFIVCATNKSAEQMLAILKARLPRSPQQELAQAALEQQKISKIRMEAFQ
jgi:2-oxo-4-hydroxy-4-carboxy-5-ureidoimidazoline decarboxylase